MATIYERKDSPYFWCTYTAPTGGIIKRSTRCKKDAALKKKALLIANDWETQLWRNYQIGSHNQPQYYFDDLITRWITATNPGITHIYNIEQLSRFFSNRCLNTLNAKDINSYKAQRPVSNSTIRRELSVLRCALNYAIKELDWNIPNPCIGRVPAQNKHVIRWLTKEEARKLRSAAKVPGAPAYLIDFIDLALNTGMRKMEMLALEVNRIDMKAGVIYLCPEHQKNREYDVVPLNAIARSAIIRQLNSSTRYLFPGKLPDTHLTDVKNPFRQCLKRAGIKNFRVHDLRHTFASWLVQGGADLYRVKELMRHSSITQTEKYAHLTPKHTADSLDSLLRYYYADEEPEKKVIRINEKR